MTHDHFGRSRRGSRFFEAFIEYDDLHLYLNPGRAAETPFSEGTDEVIPFVDCHFLRQNASSNFLEAIAGSADRTPVYPARGLPEGASPRVIQALQGTECGSTISWLLLEELKTCFSRREIAISDLDLGSQLLLDCMEFLTQELGPDRVRLVFKVSAGDYRYGD